MNSSLTWLRLFAALLTALTSGCKDVTPIPVSENTIFTTWLQDPTTSMTVQWISESLDYPDLKTDLFNDQKNYSVPAIPKVPSAQAFFSDQDGLGLRLPLLHRWAPVPSDDLSTRLSLGYTSESMLFRVYVADDHFTEDASLEALYQADSHELFLIDPENTDNRVQIIIAAGRDPDQEDIRIHSIDHRPEELQQEILCDVERKDLSENEYILQVRIPWTSLGWSDPEDRSVRIQVYLNDKDANKPEKDIFTLYPGIRTHREPLNSSEFVLSGSLQGTVPLLTSFEQQGQDVKVRVEKEYENETDYSIVFPDNQTVQLNFLELNGRRVAEHVFSHPTGNSYGSLLLQSVDKILGTVEIPLAHKMIPNEQKSIALMDAGGRLIQKKPVTHHSFDPEGNFRTYRLQFNGLEPETVYTFQLKETGPTYSFRTAPATLENGLIFAEGGDVGTDQEVVSALHRMAGSWDPAFGLLGGDLAYANGKDISKWLEYLELWSEHMRGPQGNLIPMLVTIGNHEVIGGYGSDPSKAPFFYSLFGGADGKFDGGANATYDFGSYLRIIALDSGHTLEVYEQSEWLDTVLQEGQSFDYLFAAYHVPAYPSHRDYDGDIMVQIREHWTPLFDKYRVPVVFEHHDHTYKRTHPLVDSKIQEGGTVYLGDGAWGRNPREVYPEKRPYLAVAKSSLNVIKVTLTNAKATFEAYDENHDILDRMEMSNE